MSLSNKAKVTAIQNSIETRTDAGLANPENYKQHNLHIATGRPAILALLHSLPHDKVYVNVVRAFEDGDFGFVHVDYHLFGHVVAFDIHRFEDGLSVEHWDNLQDNPLIRNPGGHTMTDGKTQAKDHGKTGENKVLAERFVQEVLVEGKTQNAPAFFEGDELLQHNPDMNDGVANFLATRKAWQEQGTPALYQKIHRVLGEGNFVLVLSEGEFKGKHTAFYDLYRIENGKIAEHWDVVEEIPAPQDQKNSNGKF